MHVTRLIGYDLSFVDKVTVDIPDDMDPRFIDDAVIQAFLDNDVVAQENEWTEDASHPVIVTPIEPLRQARLADPEDAHVGRPGRQ